MPDYHVVARFPHLNGKPEDEVMNTWTFRVNGSAGASDDSNVIANDLTTFYNTTAPLGGHAVTQYFKDSIIRAANACFFDFYDITGKLDGQAHGSPFVIRPFTCGQPNPGATGLPAELAICLSFYGDLTGLAEEIGDVRPRARRRGRVYLGPLNNIVREDDPATGRTRVTQQCRDTLASAADRLRTSNNHDWCVWSRANAALAIVQGGFVDDAFDVQRRRGEASQMRSVFTPG